MVGLHTLESLRINQLNLSTLPKKILDPSPSSDTVDASVQYSPENAISIAETALTIEPHSIEIGSYGYAGHEATATGGFLAKTMSTGIVFFRIVPTDGLPIGTSVAMELNTQHNGGGGILGVGIDRVGGGRVTRRTTNGVERFNLEVGTYYQFRSDTRLHVSFGSDSYTATYSLEVLGLSRQFWLE